MRRIATIGCLMMVFIIFSSFISQKNKEISLSESTNRIGLNEGMSMTLLSYNVWGLPVWLPGIERKERYPKIVKRLNKLQPTVFCLQECFDPRIREQIMEGVSEDYYSVSDYYCNSGGWVKKDCQGGLLTMSKYPIIHEHFYQFPIYKDMKLDERTGEKGFLVSTLDTEYGEVHVINTHLYSGRGWENEGFRMKQVKYIENIIDSLSLKDHPLFLLGDLNTRHPKLVTNTKRIKVYNYLTDSLGFEDSKQVITEGDCTYDAVNNPYASKWYYKSEGRAKLDYFLYYLPNKCNVNAERQKVIFKGDKAFSDHYGVWAEFNLTCQ